MRSCLRRYIAVGEGWMRCEAASEGMCSCDRCGEVCGGVMRNAGNGDVCRGASMPDEVLEGATMCTGWKDV